MGELTLQPKQVASQIRKTLITQKEKLLEYLKLLEKEEEDILSKNPDKLLNHIELEKNIIEELSSLKIILNPLEEMYYNSPYKKDITLKDIKNSISYLSDQITTKATRNKEKLETILESVKAELNGIKNIDLVKSSYVKIESNLVDING